MRCYYDVLQVDRGVDNDALKKAYFKMSLKYHPDKNADKTEEYTKLFQEIQEAYRAWYDRHRDVLLNQARAKDYVDNSLDLLQFFTSSCYSGYSEGNEKNFYSVYSNVFDKIRQEEFDVLKLDNMVPKISSQFFPDFGNASSDYENEVRIFYQFWQGFFTKKKFYWLDKYDLRAAHNGYEKRVMEDENKKIRDQAKKERNQLVRELVNYVKKRDRRVLDQQAMLLEKAEKHRQEVLARAVQKRREENEALAQEWLDQQSSGGSLNAQQADYIEAQLESLEREWKAAMGLSSYSDESNKTAQLSQTENHDDVDEDDAERIYCLFCSKEFGTIGMLKNHENSRKHKMSVQKYAEKNKEEIVATYDDPNETEEVEIIGTTIDEKQVVDDPTPISHSELKRLRQKAKRENRVILEKDSTTDLQLTCAVCSQKFDSRNALFAHIKESGHAALKVDQGKTITKQRKVRK